MFDNVKCPKCGKSHFMLGPSFTTCVYCPTIIKDGKVVSDDVNQTTTQCTCQECGTIFYINKNNEVIAR